MSQNKVHAPVTRKAQFRFHAELNDFVPREKRQQTFNYAFHGTPSVKDAIEALGVPHTEVDVVLLDDCSVGFDHLLRGGERVAVYPTFECVDVTPLTRLRPAPLRDSRFIADIHLGSLARHLRLLGFDTLWERDLGDELIVELSLAERRIILTRDKGILKNGRVTHGYWVRSTDPVTQLKEVVRAIDLVTNIRPYTRCMECNGDLEAVERAEVAHSVPLQVYLVHRDFRRCQRCLRVYWRGSHLRRLDRIIAIAQKA